MIVRREAPGDGPAVHAVHAAAFARAGQPAAGPAEATLVDELRSSRAWLPELSLVATAGDAVAGHVLCTRATVDGRPVLGLGPLGVAPERQGSGVGTALMHAVIGAADALDEPLIVLLGSRYYRRFGFVDAADLEITPPVAEWARHFQARRLTAYDPALRGRFCYAEPFNRV